MRPFVAVATVRTPVVIAGGRRCWGRWFTTIAALLLVSGLVAAPNAAAAPPVTTFGELSTAFATGGTVVLGADITSPGQPLDVEAPARA